MRRLALAVLISGVALLPIGCGGSGSSSTGKAGADGGAGKDGAAGSAAGTGGGGAGTGGGGAGTGGGGAGTGGLAGNDGGAAGSDGGAAGSDASTDGDAATMTPEQARGSYLVNAVLGCNGCHQTPKTTVDGGTVNAVPFAGNDCFAKDTGGGCLASANLTNDATGIKNLSDQQVIDAFTKGIDPDKVDGGTVYLFANMPYYQFSNLSTDDAKAIVAYLRTIAGVNHTVAANTGTFATRPTAAQWTPVTLADLPSPAAADGGTDAGSADAGAADAGTSSTTSNGKYLAALMCSTCHTVNTAATAPLQLDATKAFQGGKKFNTTVQVPADGGTDAGVDGGDAGATMSVTKEIQSMNLTPDTTGLKTWTAAQIVTAIKKGTDEEGRTICSPMRPFPNLTDKDATDIAAYLQAIPPAVNAITETCE
jgi:hypothetical protein